MGATGPGPEPEPSHPYAWLEVDDERPREHPPLNQGLRLLEGAAAATVRVKVERDAEREDKDDAEELRDQRVLSENMKRSEIDALKASGREKDRRIDELPLIAAQPADNAAKRSTETAPRGRQMKKEKEEVEARRAKRKAEAEARIVNKLARIQRQFDQVRWTPRVAIRCACTTRSSAALHSSPRPRKTPIVTSGPTALPAVRSDERHTYSREREPLATLSPKRASSGAECSPRKTPHSADEPSSHAALAEAALPCAGALICATAPLRRRRFSTANRRADHGD